jgi:hypothetical protein
LEYFEGRFPRYDGYSELLSRIRPYAFLTLVGFPLHTDC